MELKTKLTRAGFSVTRAFECSYHYQKLTPRCGVLYTTEGYQCNDLNHF